MSDQHSTASASTAPTGDQQVDNNIGIVFTSYLLLFFCSHIHLSILVIDQVIQFWSEMADYHGILLIILASYDILIRNCIVGNDMDLVERVINSFNFQHPVIPANAAPGIHVAYLFVYCLKLMHDLAQVRAYLIQHAEAHNQMDIDMDVPVERVSFDAFCHGLSNVPEDYAFMAPFTGTFPNRRVAVDPPMSIAPSSCYYACDVDSAHLVGPSIPVVGRLAFYTLVNHKFTIAKNLKFKFQIDGFDDPIELKKIPNFRIGQFGELGRWNVSNSYSFTITLA